MTVNAPWLELVHSCLENSEIDKKVEILERINRLLPVESMIKLPAFVTNDYIDRTLYLLEERLNSGGNLKIAVNANNEHNHLEHQASNSYLPSPSHSHHTRWPPPNKPTGSRPREEIPIVLEAAYIPNNISDPAIAIR